MTSLRLCRQLPTALISLLCILGCDKEDPASTPEPKVILTSPVKIKVGDTWLYRRMFINEGLRKATGVPDTIDSYRFIRATGDTQIEDMPFILLEIRDRDRDKDSVFITQSRCAVHVGDSVLIQISLSKPKSGFMGELFGRVAGNSIDSLLQRIGQDTQNVFDVVTPLRFPLRPGQLQTYRTSGIGMNEMRSLRYLGEEHVTTPAGSVLGWKFEMIMPDYFPKDVRYFQWIGPHGLLKYHVYGGVSTITKENSASGRLDSIVNSEIVEYMGTEDISEDTLHPWSWYR
jgi:hypothetical protein